MSLGYHIRVSLGLGWWELLPSTFRGVAFFKKYLVPLYLHPLPRELLVKEVLERGTFELLELIR